MRKVYIVFVLVLTALLCQACSLGKAPEAPVSPPDPQPGRTPEQFTASEKATATSINSFGLKLFQQVAQHEPNRNLFISPLSVSMALGMAYNGSAGETREEMASVLGFSNMTPNDINQSYQGIISVLCGLDPDVILTIANSIWYDQNHAVSPEFVNNNRRYFNAEIYPVNFSEAWVPDSINHWIEYNTQGLITKMVSPPLDPSIITMIINAIYFKGCWTHPFDTASTHTVPFFKDDGTTTTCDMMVKDTILPFYSNDLFAATYLPYGNEYFNMMILLPNQDTPMESVLSSLTPANWNTWRDSFTKQNVMIGLPKLKYDYDLDLGRILVAMGMKKAFSGSADFSNMFPNGGMYLSKVLHRAVVQVDEFGTEAAAVTIVVGTSSVPPQIYCNRPFIFIIYEKVSGTILFMGKISEPVWED